MTEAIILNLFSVLSLLIVCVTIAITIRFIMQKTLNANLEIKAELKGKDFKFVIGKTIVPKNKR